MYHTLLASKSSSPFWDLKNGGKCHSLKPFHRLRVLAGTWMHARYAKSVLIASRPFVCLRCQTRIAAAARRIPARFQHTDAPPSPSSDQLRDVLKKHPSIQGNVQQTFYEHNGGGDSLGWAPLDQKQKSEDSLGVSQASAGPAKETDPSGAASEGGKALVEKPSSSKKQKPSVSRRERGKNHAREKKNTKKRKAAALRQKRSLNHDGAEQGPGVGVQSSEQTSQAASAHDATKSGQKAVKKKKDKLDIQAAEVKKTLQKKANLRKQAQGATQGKPPTIRKQDAKAPVVRKVSALSKDEKLDAKATKGKKNATIESVTASGLKITRESKQSARFRTLLRPASNWDWTASCPTTGLRAGEGSIQVSRIRISILRIVLNALSVLEFISYKIRDHAFTTLIRICKPLCQLPNSISMHWRSMSHHPWTILLGNWPIGKASATLARPQVWPAFWHTFTSCSRSGDR